MMSPKTTIETLAVVVPGGNVSVPDITAKSLGPALPAIVAYGTDTVWLLAADSVARKTAGFDPELASVTTASDTVSSGRLSVNL
jgi:hypothetical protein